MRVRTGVIEIGRKSACCVGAGSFGTGWMEADFHCVGMVEVLMDRDQDPRYKLGFTRLTDSVIISAKSIAPAVHAIRHYWN